ncbi:hypothetical protein MTR67_027669 [Solanum verrucosum]|uniref:Uncharacterized protein n=1 Tax=Solanum verrucosum TaxID=315347 RepID=A0AAF0TVX1_SOLVR|nr:hypothetical protein MTR67_027669 [Solanum verrucosum]
MYFNWSLYHLSAREEGEQVFCTFRRSDMRATTILESLHNMVRQVCVQVWQNMTFHVQRMSGTNHPLFFRDMRVQLKDYTHLTYRGKIKLLKTSVERRDFPVHHIDRSRPCT